MQQQPNTISVQVDVERSIDATGAHLFVEVRGDSVFSGKSALSKAREVRELIENLRAAGIGEDAVHVTGVQTEVASGLITKSSSAKYNLRIEVPTTEQVTDVLAAVTNRKNAALTSITWQYADERAHKDEMLREALAAAQARAALICEGIGHETLGVHTLREHSGSPNARPQAMRKLASARSSGPVSGEDFGLSLTHSKQLTLTLNVDYLVAPV